MSEFKIGDVAEIVRGSNDYTSFPWLIGKEVTINSTEHPHPHYPKVTMHECLIDGQKWEVDQRWLRKKRPPEELSDWTRIEAITGWNPSRVSA